MNCPKCKSKHIRDGRCVLCGAVVVHTEYAAKRICPCCGRNLVFDGSCCKDCAEAIAKGAVILKTMLRAKLLKDKEKQITCPALAKIEDDLQKWLVKAEIAREKKRERERRYRAEGRKKRDAEAMREHNRRYYQQNKDDPEFKKRRAETAQRYYYRLLERDPGYLERKREAARKRVANTEYRTERNRRARERLKDWKENDPEKYRRRMEQNAKAKKKYYERIRNDPERWAQRMEKERERRSKPENREKAHELNKKYREKVKLKLQNLRFAAEEEFKKAHFLDELAKAGGTISRVSLEG